METSMERIETVYGEKRRKRREKSYRKNDRKSARPRCGALAREGWRRRASDGRAEDAATLDGSARRYIFIFIRASSSSARSFVRVVGDGR